MAPPFASVTVNPHGDEMTTRAFKKKIYEVKVRTYFVLKPRIEIKNWILVSYLNSIYNLFLQARTSNYLAQNIFLIAKIYVHQRDCSTSSPITYGLSIHFHKQQNSICNDKKTYKKRSAYFIDSLSFALKEL